MPSRLFKDVRADHPDFNPNKVLNADIQRITQDDWVNDPKEAVEGHQVMRIMALFSTAVCAFISAQGAQPFVGDDAHGQQGKEASGFCAAHIYAITVKSSFSRKLCQMMSKTNCQDSGEINTAVDLKVVEDTVRPFIPDLNELSHPKATARHVRWLFRHLLDKIKEKIESMSTKARTMKNRSTDPAPHKANAIQHLENVIRHLLSCKENLSDFLNEMVGIPKAGAAFEHVVSHLKTETGRKMNHAHEVAEAYIRTKYPRRCFSVFGVNPDGTRFDNAPNKTAKARMLEVSSLVRNYVEQASLAWGTLLQENHVVDRPRCDPSYADLVLTYWRQRSDNESENILAKTLRELCAALKTNRSLSDGKIRDALNDTFGYSTAHASQRLSERLSTKSKVQKTGSVSFYLKIIHVTDKELKDVMQNPPVDIS